jgi:PleD family two-component response regulator
VARVDTCESYDPIVPSEPDGHWTPQEIASFLAHPGNGRILTVRPGAHSDSVVEACLRSAGYCLGRLPITRDTSNLPQAAATFNPDVIYVTLVQPLQTCLSALEELARDPKTRSTPIVALVSEQTPTSVIEEAYSRAGCDFFRMGCTQVELLARTHLLTRLARMHLRDGKPFHEPPLPEAANTPLGQRLELRDVTGVYSSTYLRHRLPLEIARAHRYQRSLSLFALRSKAAAADGMAATKIARVIAENCRDVDIVARLEPDLFVVLLPETSEIGLHAFSKRTGLWLANSGIAHSCGGAALGGAGKDAIYSAAALLERACRRADEAVEVGPPDRITG